MIVFLSIFLYIHLCFFLWQKKHVFLILNAFFDFWTTKTMLYLTPGDLQHCLVLLTVNNKLHGPWSTQNSSIIKVYLHIRIIMICLVFSIRCRRDWWWCLMMSQDLKLSRNQYFVWTFLPNMLHVFHVGHSRAFLCEGWWGLQLPKMGRCQGCNGQDPRMALRNHQVGGFHPRNLNEDSYVHSLLREICGVLLSIWPISLTIPTDLPQMAGIWRLSKW